MIFSMIRLYFLKGCKASSTFTNQCDIPHYKRRTKPYDFSTNIEKF